MSMDILQRLKAGRDVLGSVTVNGVELGLRVLSDKDYQDATLAAEALMAKHETELSLATNDAFESEKSWHLISRMLVDPATGNPVFASAEEAASTLMRHDKDLISAKYLEHEEKFSPSSANLSNEAFAALLEEVKKNPEMTLSSVSSFGTLKRLITSLVGQPSS
jgi:hypothetical protein